MITYENAEKEIIRLTNYITLIDTHKISSIEDLIIYQYAVHNSLSKTQRRIKEHVSGYDFEIDIELITQEYIRDTILTKPKNELHAIVRTAYNKKTRPQRRKTQSQSS